MLPGELFHASAATRTGPVLFWCQRCKPTQTRESQAQGLSSATRTPISPRDGYGRHEQIPEVRGIEGTMRLQKLHDLPASRSDTRSVQSWRAQFLQRHPMCRFQVAAESAEPLSPWRATAMMARAAPPFPAHQWPDAVVAAKYAVDRHRRQPDLNHARRPHHEQTASTLWTMPPAICAVRRQPRPGGPGHARQGRCLQEPEKKRWMA